MHEAITLTEGLKMELVWWVLGGLCALPTILNGYFSLYQKIKKKTEDAVTRPEFNALKDTVTDLQETAITRSELSAITENLKEVKDFQRNQDKTLFTLSNQISELIGQMKANKA